MMRIVGFTVRVAFGIAVSVGIAATASGQFPYFSQSGSVPVQATYQAVADPGGWPAEMELAPADRAALADYLGGDPGLYAYGEYPVDACAGGDCESCDEAAGSSCDQPGGCSLLGGPYGDGTCAPHWFDVHAEFMYLKRDASTRLVPFTLLDTNPSDTNIAGPIVLDTGDLDLGEAPGFRVTGTYQVTANSHLEATYFGTLFWRAAAAAGTAGDNLYSVLSNFGAQPPGGFLQTDQATLHAIDYTSQLNNVELNWRHHWMSPGYWLHGSWLAGARYVRLEEHFGYFTQVLAHDDPLTPPVDPAERGPAQMNYRVSTTNDLVGFQLGGDLFACLLPGLMVGSELKAGVFGNLADQGTVITATNLNPAVVEARRSQEVALVAEAGAMAVYQITPWLSLRGGYQALFVDGVALAPENFNTVAPFPPVAPSRVPVINDNGNVFYHGFTAGLEWLW